jgi:hypothetical protein
MSTRALALVLVVLGGVAAAAESERGTTIVLENDRITPSRMTVGAAEPIVFENRSTHTMSVAFSEPADLRDRAPDVLRPHGGPTEGTPILWRWERGGLTALVPPGRSAMLGPLPAGHYAFLVTREDARPRREQNAAGGPPEKGEIEVE